jgi:hypothetical protein
MDPIASRLFSQLTYEEPLALLRAARLQTDAFAAGTLTSDVRLLRNSEGKIGRERREAAMFCHLLGQRLGLNILMATEEAQDYDFVASWSVGEARKFLPVQLKELPGEELNATIVLEKVLAGLTNKYKNTVVAVHLNRLLTIDPMQASIPSNLAVSGLWFFGAIAPDLLTWGLWGDFVSIPTGTAHAYPDA